jgi:uncharacterized membrane protein YoaK (UPF0700 family)
MASGHVDLLFAVGVGARISLIGAIWLGYVGGATGGALLDSAWHLGSLALPIGLLVVLAAMSVTTARRRR